MNSGRSVMLAGRMIILPEPECLHYGHVSCVPGFLREESRFVATTTSYLHEIRENDHGSNSSF